MLVLATGFLYWVLARDLDTINNEFLSNKIEILRAILREHPQNAEGLEEVKSGGAYYVRILNEKMQTMIETPGMGNILYVSLFPPPLQATETPVTGITWMLPDNRSYLLMAAWAEPGNPGRKRHILQVAMDVSNEEAIIANYRRKLSIVLLLGILFSGGAGIVVARKGMRPLAEITKAAQQITATHLHERIGTAPWPKELSTLAAAFDEMLERLEDSFKRLSQFSADLAHELRSPINNLIGEAEVALSRSRTPEEYRTVIESSLEEFGRLSRMIDGLLFLARAENPETRIERVQLDVRKELEAVREFHDAVAQEQEVEVTCEGQASLSADPILFRRAISNLISNALQYTPRGGKILLSARQPDDQSIEVRVSDTGSGIASEHLSKIFDRFYRADPARSQYPQGTGLGLSIVKSIMDLHGGTVAIQSKAYKGTTVILRFPRQS
jgi:two-component system heavy metal sensor histidine kinase CusS